MSPSDTNSKEDRALLLLLGLVRETLTADCSVTLIFSEVLAKSVGLM